MFNIDKEVNKLQQLQYAKISGLPTKRKPISPEIPHIDSSVLETKAQQESIAISKSFKNKSVDFGRRLSKVKGQKHYPGGGFAMHTERR